MAKSCKKLLHAQNPRHPYSIAISSTNDKKALNFAGKSMTTYQSYTMDTENYGITLVTTWKIDNKNHMIQVPLILKHIL